MVELSTALDFFEQKITNGNAAIEEDLLFHIKIAEAGKNSVLKSLMMIITPDIVKSFTKFKVCETDVSKKSIEEHRDILEKISERDPEGAVKAMSNHLDGVVQFSLKN